MQTLEKRIADLEALLAHREATLDAISYKCFDYDVEWSQAESMTGEPWPFMRGRYKAGSEINKIIVGSGYSVKCRPEED